MHDGSGSVPQPTFHPFFPGLSLESRNRYSSLRFSDARDRRQGTAVRVGTYRQPTMTPDYIRVLDDDLGIRMAVEFKSRGREVTDYAVVLLRGGGSAAETIRVYDGAHGHNEMHRYISRAPASNRERHSTAVPWEKECEPRSMRSKAAIAR
jgi:hypothetical protein